MTPTEQDKELFENSFGEWLENHGVELIGNNPSHLGTWRAMVDMNELKLAVMQLITADRKRVALEARIYEVEKLELPKMRFDEYGYSPDENAVGFNSAIQYAHNKKLYRIAELKSQQELEKL